MIDVPTTFMVLQRTLKFLKFRLRRTFRVTLKTHIISLPLTRGGGHFIIALLRRSL